MTYQWATWMLAALRADPVIAPKIIEVPGWQTHGRPPAEFSFFPSGLLDHHTACMCRIGHDPQSCINVIRAGHGTTPGPISQLLGTFTRPGTKWNGSNVDPHIAIIAAGRANHAGTGEYSWGAPGGNGSSIGIEWCGPVDGWPDQVIEFRERVDAALLRNRNWGVHQLDTHYSYARPLGRKIDQSGRYIGQPNLTLLQPHDRDIWRSRVHKRLVPAPVNPIDYQRIAMTTGFEFASAPRWDTRGFGKPQPDGMVSNPLPAGEYDVQLAGSAGKVGATVNLTITSPTGHGFATLWRGGPRPNESKINWVPRQTIANEVAVALAADGRFKIYLSSPAHVIIDLTGYWL